MEDEPPGQPGLDFADLSTTSEITELPSKKKLGTVSSAKTETARKNNGKHDSPALLMGGRLTHFLLM